jgi:hypothetical protein
MSRYNLKNFANGDEYYKKLDEGVERDLYVDSVVLGDLNRYNKAIQNYWLGMPIIKKNPTTYRSEKLVNNNTINNNMVNDTNKKPKSG